MGEVVNLRRFRKTKQRTERETLAQSSRRLHGTAEAERRESAARKTRQEQLLDGHRREPEGSRAEPGVSND